MWRVVRELLYALVLFGVGAGMGAAYIYFRVPCPEQFRVILG